MVKILKATGKIAFITLLLIFVVAFFLYKQYWLSFFTLALILIFPRWEQVKKIIVGKDKIEVQIPEKIITSKGRDNAEDTDNKEAK